MNITITINTDNDSFGTDQWQQSSEVAWILRSLATEMLLEDVVEETKIKDSNGNTVGELTIKE